MFKRGEENPFKGIGETNAGNMRNNYIDIPGSYLLQIDTVENFESRKKQTFFKVEFEIIDSDVEERPAGMRVTYMTDIYADMGFVNVKRFLAAACGYEPNSDEANKEIDEVVALKAIKSDQPLQGRLIFCEAIRLESDFVAPHWHPVDDQDDDY